MTWSRKNPKPETPYSKVARQLAEEKRQRRRQRDLDKAESKDAK